MACTSAAGRAIPPLVNFRRKSLNGALIEGEVPETMYGLGGRGWIDSEIFHDWFKFHFLLHAPAVRPLLLLLDGHSSHFHPGSIELAARDRVIIFCLPPNTTHLQADRLAEESGSLFLPLLSPARSRKPKSDSVCPSTFLGKSHGICYMCV